MGSKFGFDQLIAKVPRIEKEFLSQGMKAAQREFAKNFDDEKDNETGTPWEMVLRGYPPPILDVTGKLRAEAISSKNVAYFDHKAVLTIDPIDERGRGYASYHMDGTPNMPDRKYVTQSKNLDREQKNVLLLSAQKVLG